MLALSQEASPKQQKANPNLNCTLDTINTNFVLKPKPDPGGCLNSSTPSAGPGLAVHPFVSGYWDCTELRDKLKTDLLL